MAAGEASAFVPSWGRSEPAAYLVDAAVRRRESVRRFSAQEASTAGAPVALFEAAVLLPSHQRSPPLAAAALSAVAAGVVAAVLRRASPRSSPGEKGEPRGGGGASEDAPEPDLPAVSTRGVALASVLVSPSPRAATPRTAPDAALLPPALAQLSDALDANERRLAADWSAENRAHRVEEWAEHSAQSGAVRRAAATAAHEEAMAMLRSAMAVAAAPSEAALQQALNARRAAVTRAAVAAAVAEEARAAAVGGWTQAHAQTRAVVELAKEHARRIAP